MSTMWNNRFMPVRKLADTLQGEIWMARDLSDNNRAVVVKITYRSLVDSGKSRTGHHVREDIHNEIKILKYLSKQRNRNDGFCHLIDEWQTHNRYFYAMEFCAAELFQFISNAFTPNGIMCNFMLTQQTLPQIPRNANNKHEWLHKVQMMFRQMVKVVYWMHTRGIVHQDLSLENTLIYNINETLCWGYCRARAAPNQVPSNVVRLCLKFANLSNTIAEFRDSRIKIIDFGLAKQYPENNKTRGADLVNGYIRNLFSSVAPIFYRCFNPEIINCCTQFHGGLFSHYQRVGKVGYMAPEVYSLGCIYDTRAADIFSLGVILFMMTIGAPPYKRPTTTDAAFNLIINGRLADVLRHWRRLNLISTDVLDLMEKIFKYEPDRISMEELIRHPFVDLIDELTNKKQHELILVTQEQKIVHSNADSKYDNDGDENMNDVYNGAGIRDEDIHFVKDTELTEVIMEDGVHVETNQMLADLENTETEIQMVNAVMSIDDLIQTFSK